MTEADAEVLAALARHNEAERAGGIGSFEYRPPEVVIWSDQLFRLYGMDPERNEPLATDAWDARVNPADSAMLERLYAGVVAGGKYQVDFRFRGLDDVERHLQLRGDSTLDESGEVRRVVGTVQDVTELKATERRLRDSERRLVEAQRVAAVGSFEGCRDTGEFVWSDELYRLFALDPAGARWSLAELMARMSPVPDVVASSPPPGPFAFEHELTRADGIVRSFQVNGEAYVVDGVTRIRGTVRDVTAIRRAEVQQATVARLSRKALEGVPTVDLFQFASREVALALRAEAAGVSSVRTDGSGSLEIVAGHGLPDEVLGAERPPPALQVARQVMATGEPALIRDWRGEHPDWGPGLLLDAEIRSALVVPIHTRDGLFGTLGVGSYIPGRFSAAATDFLVSAANVLAAAIERQRREEHIEALAKLRGRLVAQTLDAEERTRRRVSEAIHDGALQDLLASRQDLVEAAEDGEGTVELVRSAREGVERAVEELREAVQALHPVVLQHGGLEAAVRAAADHAARSGGFRPAVSVDRNAVGAWDELLLSVARELLTNAAKHAGAAEVSVTVERRPETILLEVADDGQGISRERLAAAPREGHIGLASLVERVEAVGGRTEIDSPPQGGARVRAVLPLAPG